MNESKLKLLGLNSYEIKVLLTLIYKGKSKASTLTQNSGVPSGKIYETLQSLEEKGLVATIPETVKYFVAKPITHLKELLKEKQKQLLCLDKELQELETLSAEQSKGDIVVVKGKNAFHRMVKTLDKAKTFNYTLKWNVNITDMNFQKSSKEAIKRNVLIKTLYDVNTPKENIDYWRKKFSTKNPIKYIQGGKIAMGITDTQVFFSIVELNSTVIISSDEFSHLMKQFFEAYWDNYQDP